MINFSEFLQHFFLLIVRQEAGSYGIEVGSAHIFIILGWIEPEIRYSQH